MLPYIVSGMGVLSALLAWLRPSAWSYLAAATLNAVAAIAVLSAFTSW